MKKSCKNEIFIIGSGFQPAYIRELVNAFSKAGCYVKLIGGNIHKDQHYGENVHFINLRGDDSSSRSPIVKIIELFTYYIKLILEVYRSATPIIYNASVGRPFINEICTYSIFKLMGKKIIHTVHNILPHGKANFKNKLLYFIIYRFIADYLIVHTEHLKKKLVLDFKVAEKKVTIVPHGTYHIQNTQHITKASARKWLDLNGNKFVILSFGQQYYYKGTHVLLKAMADLKPSPFYHIIRGTANKEYADLLNNIIQEADLGHVVDCKFGYVSDQQMETLFKASDVVVLPYLEGSQSGVLFMAYAFGRPILASDTGSFKNFIKPGETGEIFKMGDSISLIKSLKKIRQNYSGYKETFIKKYALDNYSWSTCVNKILTNIYNEN